MVSNNKVAPVGNIFNHLKEDQIISIISSMTKRKEENLSTRSKTLINLVMDTLKSYFNPLEHILDDSEIENGLENLFSLESMGIKRDENGTGVF